MWPCDGDEIPLREVIEEYGYFGYGVFEKDSLIIYNFT